MDALHDAARRVGLAWTPGYTTLVIVVGAVALGFMPFAKMSLVVNGVFVGAIIAVGAIGLTLIYGILNFANIAHGDYMTMGAYLTLFLVGSSQSDSASWATGGVLPALGIESAVGLGPFTFGYPVLIALPITVAVVASGAVVLDIAVYRRLRDRGVNAVVLAMTSLGVAIAMRGLVQIIWGGETHQLPRESKMVYHLPMDVRVAPDAIFVAAAAVVLVTVVYIVLTHTRMGKAMRATADNADLALVSGIDTRRVIRWTWALGAGLAATAGVMLAVFQAQLLPVMGWRFLIPLFAAVILGGARQSVWGAGGGLRHRRGVGRVSTQWINPQLQAGGGVRDHDPDAAAAAAGHIRERGVTSWT